MSCVEAIFGAVYLDSGLDAARAVIEKAYGERLELAQASSDLRDPKSRLQEYLQGRGWPLPEYLLLEVTGEQHAQLFKVACRLSRPALRVEGQGGSRRKAEQSAARAALDRLDDHDR